MSKRKNGNGNGKHKHNKNIEFLTTSLNNNAAAIEEHKRRKKKWSPHDLRNIKPLTPNQESMFKQYFRGDQLCTYGSAGTGKTFLALYLALMDVLDKALPQRQLIIVRSAVATRDIGFMPGTLEEKVSLYEMPYRDILTELTDRTTAYDDLKSSGIISFMTTSFIRGLTWDDAIVIIDEGQNMSWHEINSVMTRVGANSRVIFTGDLVQTDLNKNGKDKCGMQRFLKTVIKMKEFSTVQFTIEDIVRGKLVKSWIVASEKTA